jgi:hypothetical protein
MKYDEFHRPISVDFVPRGRVCEWCGKPAERQLTAIGGTYHNQSGAFCHSCGELFLGAVINSTQTSARSQMRPN